MLPVSNGMIPGPSQEMSGMFVGNLAKRALAQMGQGSMCGLLPFDPEFGLYPVGSAVSIEDLWFQDVWVPRDLKIIRAMFARVVGKGRLRVNAISVIDGIPFAEDAEILDFRLLRHRYPVVDGAGWIPLEGSTEARDSGDVRIEIFGTTYDGRQVCLSANVGRIVSQDVAHTIEHAMIRSLKRFAIATPRTLRDSMMDETADLKASIDAGYRFRMPEFFGLTATGACGNPLTNLAHFYLADELMKNLSRGLNFTASLCQARLTTLSRVTQDLDLPTASGPGRVLAGLKRGMLHDDTPVDLATLKAVLRRFPLTPLE